MNRSPRILEISNYPPPRCGWSIRTQFLAEHLRESGVECEVLNIGPSRRVRRPDCIDVQGGADYLWKLVRFAVRRYRFHAHVNGDSPKGFLLTSAALSIGLAFGLRPILTFHAGVSQHFFPRRTLPWRLFFRVLFGLPRSVICNSEAVRGAIASYGVSASKIHVIPAFTARYVEDLGKDGSSPEAISRFRDRHSPVLVCYAYYRPEFALEHLLRSLANASQDWVRIGLILIGDLRGHEPIAVLAGDLHIDDRILFAGDLPHGQFLSTLRDADLYVRTHLRDGVASSVLEALAVGTPVLASKNESRPADVMTYDGNDPDDLDEKLRTCLADLSELKRSLERMAPGADTLDAEMKVLIGGESV